MSSQTTWSDELREQLAALSGDINDGQAATALTVLAGLTELHPDNADVLALKGTAHAVLGQYAESAEAFESAIKCRPASAELHYRLAMALQRGGRYEDALAAYAAALEYAPGSFDIARSKCSVLIDLARWQEAADVLGGMRVTVKSASATREQRVAVALLSARLSPHVIDPADAIAELEPFGSGTDLGAGYRAAVQAQLGRLYDKMGEYENAFHSWSAAKEINKPDWDPDEYSRHIRNLIGAWTGKNQVPPSNMDGSRLIFIVGMMRSGTSLVEQMLSQVPEITPGGEMNAISRQVFAIDRVLPYLVRPLPLSPERYTKKVMDRISANAWDMYAAVAADGFITDKQPYNCFYVPLIARMFPGCRFIHCIRDAEDCCFSNFTIRFSKPHPQTHDLYWMGRFFRDYEMMMEAWRMFPDIHMTELRYEELVQHPEPESRRVMEFLGLDWTREILEFHQSERTVATSSRQQVRKPLYTTSMNRIAPYSTWLGELRRGLG